MTQSDVNQILDSILPWLRNKTQDSNREIDPGTELIKENLLDSIEFLELVSFLEDTFNVELDADLLTPENFNTPSDIANMVSGVLQ